DPEGRASKTITQPARRGPEPCASPDGRARDPVLVEAALSVRPLDGGEGERHLFHRGQIRRHRDEPVGVHLLDGYDASLLDLDGIELLDLACRLHAAEVELRVDNRFGSASSSAWQ